MSKPPAKRRAKRKAAAADADIDDADAGNSLLASLDLSKSRTGPKTIAAALLTLLPKDATRQHAMAQKLTKVFPMVMSELDARSIQASRASQEEGSRQPITFRFPANAEQGKKGGSEDKMWITIHLPEDSFVPCLKYLTGKEIVHCVSLVSKPFLSVSRNRGLWETLDKSAGLTNSNKKLNMTALQNLLRRSQFADLKHLMMPRHALKLSPKNIKQLAQLCPHLELFSVGYSTNGVAGPKTKDEDLIAIAEAFPKLNAIHTHMWSITGKGVVSVAKVMESRLIDLRIKGSTITGNYLSDFSLGQIAKSCPNLKHFAYKYKMSTGYYFRRELDMLTGNGILALVRNCRKLEVLELEDAKNVGRETISIEEILQMLAQSKAKAVAKAVTAGGDGAYALREINLVGYPFLVVGNPLRLVDTTASDVAAAARFNPRNELMRMIW